LNRSQEKPFDSFVTECNYTSKRGSVKQSTTMWRSPRFSYLVSCYFFLYN